ncbi:hypothetical protein imdm_1465 [gamma proteobacterium IMCC2047]|nr:hypothetical protein imdm_1465 [gamma proteobacterium IMCC2047]
MRQRWGATKGIIPSSTKNKHPATNNSCQNDINASAIYRLTKHKKAGAPPG